MYFLWYLLIGLAAGWIASLIFKGSGSGLLVNLIVQGSSALSCGFYKGWFGKSGVYQRGSTFPAKNSFS